MLLTRDAIASDHVQLTHVCCVLPSFDRGGVDAGLYGVSGLSDAWEFHSAIVSDKRQFTVHGHLKQDLVARHVHHLKHDFILLILTSVSSFGTRGFGAAEYPSLSSHRISSIKH